MKRFGVAFGLWVLGVWGLGCLASTSALGLSGGRVYERVTPFFKGGYGAGLEAVAPDGERIVFGSAGVFAGVPLATSENTYVTDRVGGSGWSTSTVQPPFSGASLEDFSKQFDLALSHVGSPSNPAEGRFVLYRFGFPDTVEGWETFGGLIQQNLAVNERVLAGASGDLCHLAVEGDFVGEPVPDPRVDELYDLSRGCGGEAPYMRLVAVTNQTGPEGAFVPISTECPPHLEGADGRTSFNAVSEDGLEIFFTVNVKPGSRSECLTGDDQVFVRLDGSRTVEVSRPLSSGEFGGCGEGGNPGEVPGEVPCPDGLVRSPAYFRGASEDGSTVFFQSAQELVSGQTDASSQLYMAHVGCPEADPECAPDERRVTSLTRVSEDPNLGQSADVQGVVDVARSGAAVYFVAHGALTSAANGEGETATVGADNLYGYDTSSHELRFVARLCSGPSQSGTIEDSNCPMVLNAEERNDADLWQGEGEAQVTSDGRFLVFASSGRLVRQPAEADTDASRDVYRYDLLTGTLARVSLGEGGYAANGNGETGASIALGRYNGGGGHRVAGEQEMASSAVSPDGSWVTFRSGEALSPHVSNGLVNVYAWHEQSGRGEVSLISSGSSLTDDLVPTIPPATMPQGRDIFFMTSAGLIPDDTENDLDVYDARIGGGFPEAGVARAPCDSDACQGPLTSPAPMLTPSTAVQQPGENWPSPVKTVKVKKKKGKPRHAKRKRLRRPVKHGRGSARKAAMVRGGVQ